MKNNGGLAREVKDKCLTEEQTKYIYKQFKSEKEINIKAMRQDIGQSATLKLKRSQKERQIYIKKESLMMSIELKQTCHKWSIGQY